MWLAAAWPRASLEPLAPLSLLCQKHHVGCRPSFVLLGHPPLNFLYIYAPFIYSRRTASAWQVLTELRPRLCRLLPYDIRPRAFVLNHLFGHVLGPAAPRKFPPLHGGYLPAPGVGGSRVAILTARVASAPASGSAPAASPFAPLHLPRLPQPGRCCPYQGRAVRRPWRRAGLLSRLPRSGRVV